MGVVMAIGFIVTLPFLLKTAGGWSGVTAKLSAEHFQILGSMSLTEALSYSLPSMLLLLGESNMYQRFFSAKDEKTAKRSVIGWLSGTIVLEILIAILAIIGSAIFLNINSETEILYSARHALPAAVGCFLLAAIVT